MSRLDSPPTPSSAPQRPQCFLTQAGGGGELKHKGGKKGSSLHGRGGSPNKAKMEKKMKKALQVLWSFQLFSTGAWYPLWKGMQKKGGGCFSPLSSSPSPLTFPPSKYKTFINLLPTPPFPIMNPPFLIFLFYFVLFCFN